MLPATCQTHDGHSACVGSVAPFSPDHGGSTRSSWAAVSWSASVRFSEGSTISTRASMASLEPSAGSCVDTHAQSMLSNNLVPLPTTTLAQSSTTVQNEKRLLPTSCFVSGYGADSVRPMRTE